MLLAGFGYFLFALGQIVYAQVAPTARGDAVSVPQAAMIATLGGGLLVAVLAAGWSAMRGLVLAIMPSLVVLRVPPVSTGPRPPTGGSTKRGARANPCGWSSASTIIWQRCCSTAPSAWRAGLSDMPLPR